MERYRYRSIFLQDKEKSRYRLANTARLEDKTKNKLPKVKLIKSYKEQSPQIYSAGIEIV